MGKKDKSGKQKPPECETSPEPEPKQEECKPEPAECKPEPVECKPEPVECKPEPVECKPEPVECKPEPVECKPEPVDCKPEPIECKPEPVECEPEPSKSKSKSLLPISKMKGYGNEKLNELKKKPMDLALKAKNHIMNFNYRQAFKNAYKTIKTMGEPGATSGRPMKFPYTFSAKIAQFPLKFYVQNQWIWKYYAISLVASFPIFIYINSLANSPGNVAKWAEIRRKEALEHHH